MNSTRDTVRADVQAQGRPARDPGRRLLRRTSIDELPQLLNVLRGELSIVGPRPEQLDLVERYAPEHQVRLEVKPGITGPTRWHHYTSRARIEGQWLGLRLYVGRSTNGKASTWFAVRCLRAKVVAH